MAKLNAAARKRLPGKDFAGPGRSYPIPDRSHAANALARSSGKAVAPEVRRKVAEKYPGLINRKGKK
jgi:hypothetical protein